MCERLDLFIAKDAWRDDVADGDSAKVSPRVGVRVFYDGACLQLAFICACWRLPRALLPLLNLLKPGKELWALRVKCYKCKLFLVLSDSNLHSFGW
jgi:hypothetical protein